MDSIPHLPLMTPILENMIMFLPTINKIFLLLLLLLLLLWTQGDFGDNDHQVVKQTFYGSLFVTIQRIEPYIAKTICT